jgi:hypothetical protein
MKFIHVAVPEFINYIACKRASDWGVQEMLSSLLGTYTSFREEEANQDSRPPLVTQLPGGAATLAFL